MKATAEANYSRLFIFLLAAFTTWVVTFDQSVKEQQRATEAQETLAQNRFHRAFLSWRLVAREGTVIKPLLQKRRLKRMSRYFTLCLKCMGHSFFYPCKCRCTQFVCVLFSSYIKLCTDFYQVRDLLLTVKNVWPYCTTHGHTGRHFIREAEAACNFALVIFFLP